jgi:glycerol-3-phosphate dehydrogenase (NAD(P)+)
VTHRLTSTEEQKDRMSSTPTVSPDAPTRERVAVIGAGAWGTTLSALASAHGPTTLWAREPEVVTAMRDHHENRLFLPDVALPAEIRATTDLEEAVADADAVVVAVPAQHVRAVMAGAAPWITHGSLVVSVAKGIEAGSAKRMTEVLADVLPGMHPDSIGVLAGPNLAREVIAGHPSATTVAFADPGAAAAIQQRLTGATFRVYTSTDVVGCEIGGAVKNVIAIAAGVAAGLGLGMNTLAALVTRGLAELTRLGVALGGDPLTFLGLAGNGDLIATCGSPLSRNHRVGQQLAEGRTVGEILASMTSVAEGVATAPVIVEMARRHDVEMPIADAVAALLDGRIAARDAIAVLMSRQPQSELHGLRGVSTPDSSA